VRESQNSSTRYSVPASDAGVEKGRELARREARRLAEIRNVTHWRRRAESAERELEAIHASTSWRLSAPVRTAKAVLRALRRRSTRPQAAPEYAGGSYTVPVELWLNTLEDRLLSFPESAQLAPSDAELISKARAWTVRHRPAVDGPGPVISVLIPTYTADPREFAAALASVLEQQYSGWELCITDDGSPTSEALELACELAAHDERIRVSAHVFNRGLAAATNTCLAMSSGEYVAFLDHDDELESHALRVVADVLTANPEIDLLYSDETRTAADGAPIGYMVKPDWSPERFRGVMYLGHLLVARRELVLEVGGLDSGFDTVQDFELGLRLSERAQSIAHIGQTLYRWRSSARSVTRRRPNLSVIEARQALAVQAHLDRVGIPARAEPIEEHLHRVRIVPLDGRPRTALTAVIVGDHTAAQATSASLEWFDDVVLVSGSETTMASAADALLAAARSNGTGFVLALEAGVELTAPGSVDALVLSCRPPGVAIAGPLVLRHDGHVSSAGWMIDADPPGIGPAYEGFDPRSEGYAGELVCAHEVSAVSGEVALLPRSFLAASTPERAYATLRYLILDLALQGLSQDKRSVVVPLAVATLPPTKTEKPDDGEVEKSALDHALLVDRWRAVFEQGDRYAPFAAVRKLAARAGPPR
jgi:hypothetical protein